MITDPRSVFDLSAAVTVKAHDPIAGYADRYGTIEDGTEPVHPLDTEPMQQLHKRLLQFLEQELDRQHENRLQMAIDEDFYDGLQWSEEDAAELIRRGQAPIVFNHIAPAVNWLLGSQKRTRTDYRVIGRTEEDNASAQTKTQLLKYLSDVNNVATEDSRVFKDAVVVGLGWQEVGVQYGDDEEEIYCRYESWRNILHDSRSQRDDLRDARYIFRMKMLDVDVATMLFQVAPERVEAVIKAAALNSVRFGATTNIEDEVMADIEDGYFGHGHNVRATYLTNIRPRVRVIECWYRKPEMVKEFRGGPLNRKPFDRDNLEHIAMLRAGASVIERVKMKVYVAFMTSTGMLYHGPSPYEHNRMPFVPVWGNLRGRDRMPYGLVRGMRDIQEDLNKRASKALHILSTNKTIMDTDTLPEGVTVDDYLEEVAQPDAVIVKNPNTTLEINADRELAPAHLDLMRIDAQMIQSASGVTDELLGRTTNAVSGAAITARQEQGSLQTSIYFDNMRAARQTRGELMLALIEQWMDEPKVARITNDKGKAEFIRLNDESLPESMIARTKADFVIDEAPYTQSYRQAMLDQFTNMAGRLGPDVARMLVPYMVEMMDIPSRDEIVKQLRVALNMPDPDEEATPEQLAQQQLAQQQQQLQMAAQALQLAELKAKTAETTARAEEIAAKAVANRLSTMKIAMEAAAIAATAPGIAPTADHMLAEAGWQDAPGADQQTPHP